MRQAIQNGVGHGGVIDDLVPLAHRELAGDQRRLLAVPVVQNLKVGGENPVEVRRRAAHRIKQCS